MFDLHNIEKMLPIFFKIVSLTLLMNVFLASTGVVVVKHQCKMRGERVFLFAKPSDVCCSKVPTSQECSIQTPACCLEQAQMHKISADFQIHLQNLVLATPPQILVALFDYKPIFSSYAPLRLSYPNLSNPPPLPAGKELLPYISTFLI